VAYLTDDYLTTSNLEASELTRGVRMGDTARLANKGKRGWIYSHAPGTHSQSSSSRENELKSYLTKINFMSG
jgi:hypothetical protein